jgi:8-oxo-dGTP pyrophosphatase MutT (NUDIX family)
MTPVRASEVLTLVRAFDPNGDARADDSVRRMVALLEQASDPFDRTAYEPGHMTASAVVLSPERDRVLLVHHRRLGRWLQPGGHVEPEDATMVHAARREVIEETGVRLADGAAHVVAVDVHPIPAARGEPPHYHHDVMFRLQAADEALAPPGRSVARWCPVSGLEHYDVDEPLQRAVAAALALPFENREV